MRALLLLALLGACANPDLGPTPEANRNVIAAGVGVASVMTDCGDGYQRSTPGIGAGLMLTGCLQPATTVQPTADPRRPVARPLPERDPSERVGILSVGLGLAVTVTNCNDFKLSGFGVGMGVVAAPCPRRPQPVAMRAR